MRKKTLKESRKYHEDLLLKYRSEIITKAIKIELGLSSIISLYFAKNPNNIDSIYAPYYILVKSNVLPFNSKREVVRRIIEVESLLPKHKRGKFDTWIQDCSKIRNSLAHNDMDSHLKDVWETEGKSIHLYKLSFDNGEFKVDSEEITEQKLIQVTESIDKALKTMKEIEDKISGH